MNFLVSIFFIILFILLLIFVFSIGMLKPYFGKKEKALTVLCGFIVGILGGAFFLAPVYEDLPDFVSSIEQIANDNYETVYFVVSSSADVNEIKNNLTHTEGVKSFDITGITVNVGDLEPAYINDIDAKLKNVNSHYTNWTINDTGKIDIDIEKDYDPYSALKSFSDWYLLAYGWQVNYGQIHAVLVVQSSHLEEVKDNLFDRDIVPSKVTGHVQDIINDVESNMVSEKEFIIICGFIGVIASILGIFFDHLAVTYRKIVKFVREKILKRRK